jgi:hypothetical protein
MAAGPMAFAAGAVALAAAAAYTALQLGSSGAPAAGFLSSQLIGTAALLGTPPPLSALFSLQFIASNLASCVVYGAGTAALVAGHRGLEDLVLRAACARRTTLRVLLRHVVLGPLNPGLFVLWFPAASCIFVESLLGASELTARARSVPVPRLEEGMRALAFIVPVLSCAAVARGLVSTAGLSPAGRGILDAALYGTALYANALPRLLPGLYALSSGGEPARTRTVEGILTVLLRAPVPAALLGASGVVPAGLVAGWASSRWLGLSVWDVAARVGAQLALNSVAALWTIAAGNALARAIVADVGVIALPDATVAVLNAALLVALVAIV